MGVATTKRVRVEHGMHAGLSSIEVICKKRNAEWNGMWNGIWNGLWNTLSLPQTC